MKDIRKRFSQLYNQNVNKIYRFVYLKVDSQATAEDITSRVFTKLWMRFRTLENNQDNNSNSKKNQDKRSSLSSDRDSDIENPKAYLYQMARAEIASYYRNKPEIKLVSLEEAAPWVPDPAPNPEQEQKNASDIEMLQQALHRLKSHHQDLLIWHYLDGLSIKEISKICRKKEETVRVALHRARKELRKVMEELGLL